MLLSLWSAKASPGVSTLSLLLAVQWPRPVVLVEADESGGVQAARLGLSAELPNLESLAAACRRSVDTAVLLEHAQPITPSVRVVCAPVGGARVVQALRVFPDGLEATLGALDVDVIVDHGRSLPSRAGTGWAVCRPRADEVFAVHAAVAGGAGASAVVCVGDRPHEPVEVAHLVGVPLAGTVPCDPGAAGDICEGALGSRAVRRSPLWRSVAPLVDAALSGIDRDEPSDIARRLSARAQPARPYGDRRTVANGSTGGDRWSL